MKIFLGSILCKIDDKHRVAIPKMYLVLLRDENVSNVILVPSVDRGHFDIYPAAYVEENIENFKESRGDTVVGRMISSPIDSVGRIRVKKDFASSNDFNSHVLFVGGGENLQIWVPEKYYEADKKAGLEKMAIRQREYAL
jgi:DNA-binding transcriptional regulator/RsmH inhibitor MraZ